MNEIMELFNENFVYTFFAVLVIPVIAGFSVFLFNPTKPSDQKLGMTFMMLMAISAALLLFNIMEIPPS